MKILFVSKPMNNSERLINVHPRLRCMSHATLIWAKTNEAVEKHIREVDVVFLNLVKETQWLAPDSPVYKVSIPVVRFFGDVWKIPGIRGSRAGKGRKKALKLNLFREYTARITPTNWLFKQNCPEWVDSMFWSPHCIDVQNYNVPKDIDGLFWGRADAAAGYTTRVKVRTLLEKYAFTDKRVDGNLLMYKMELHKCKYSLGILTPRLYSGSKLYKLLARTRVCYIAPPDCSIPGGGSVGAPVGKFFENAACGAVSLTTDFTDRKELGFEHKKNIWITDLEHYVADLAYLLKHTKLVDEMSKNAKELIRTRHTPAIRGKELYGFLCKKTGKT